MKKITQLILGLFFAGILIVAGCSKDEDVTPPTLSFKSGGDYISTDISARYGDTLNFGVNANYNGSDMLVKFQLFANGDKLLDSTFGSQTFTIDFFSVKSILDKEVWKIVITDIAGNITSDSVTVTGNFGEIYTYSDITLGAQDNATVESFLSYSNATVTKYFQAAAFEHQADIDMFCFYENTPSHVNLMTLAAPGSNITGIFTGATAPDNYTTKNVTYFVKTTLTAAQFDAVANDAVILASFDPDNKFKKAKLLTAGDVYAFKIASGKYGLLKVIAVDGAEAGTLQFAVKIQK